MLNVIIKLTNRIRKKKKTCHYTIILDDYFLMFFILYIFVIFGISGINY